MAFTTTSLIFSSSFIIFLLFSSTAIAYVIESVNDEIHLHFYMHEISGVTIVVVARNSNSTNNPTFGDVYVFDNPIVEGYDLSSKQIGRVQGSGVIMNDGSLTATFIIVFTTGKFKGSTLALTGRIEGTRDGERILTGGSGKLRNAKGYAIGKPFQADHLVVEYDIYLY